MGKILSFCQQGHVNQANIDPSKSYNLLNFTEVTPVTHSYSFVRYLREKTEEH